MIALVETVDRLRRRIGLLAVLFLLATLVVGAHGGLTMGGMPEDEAVAICVAIMQTGAVAFGLLSLATARPWGGRGIPPLFLLAAQRTPPAQAVFARAGPARLQVFLR